jgi:3'(2'), 5'-bisphosphate nucleotidase
LGTLWVPFFISNMHNHLKTALMAAVAGGKEIMSIYGLDDFQITNKSDASPLTIADQKAHLAIVKHLENTGLPVLSEEGKSIPFSERESWESFWMVDPLDGTKEFIKRNGEFTVNIALIRGGKPVLGVVYVPVTGLLYFGAENQGAWRKEVREFDDLEEPTANAHKLPAHQTQQLTIVGSRSHMSPETEAIIQQMESLHGQAAVASMGSSLKIVLVAEGKADFYPRFAPTMEWDTAAGHGVALAAGCQVIQAANQAPVVYNKENLLNPWFIVTNNRYAMSTNDG